MAGLADEIADSCEGTLDVAGVSFGGMVAQHFAVRRPPSAPRALVLDGPHMMPLERSAEFGAALSEHRRFAEAG